MNELISKDYKVQNELLHHDGVFGVSGYKWSPTVSWLVSRHAFTTVLDYGAGQQTLKKSLQHLRKIRIDCYDPAIPELANQPESAELVTCTDVLEHVEPDHIDEVLDHIQSLASRMVLLVIPTGPAAKFLPDGRNAHLIQKPLHWWLPKLINRFDIISLNHQTEDIVFIGSVKSNEMEPVDSELIKILHAYRMDSILSIAFDGYSINISVKPKMILKRLLPRLISIFKLGVKSGVGFRRKGVQHVSSVTITYW